MTLDPIHQFNINNIFTIAHIGGHTIAFTNASAYMLLTVAVVCLVGVRGFRGRQLVPGRFQSPAELSYVFVASMVRSTGGEEGMKFFPFVYSLFMFILVANVISIIPYTFSVTSQIIVTAAFALLVFFMVLIYGFYKNELKFFRIFAPPGIPIYILPLARGRHHRRRRYRRRPQPERHQELPRAVMAAAADPGPQHRHRRAGSEFHRADRGQPRDAARSGAGGRGRAIGS